MTHGAADPGRRAVRRRLDPRRWPWWGQTLAVFTATRLLTVLGFLVALAGQEPVVGMSTRSLPTFVALWYDGAWYRAIAEHGYPSSLPFGADGAVQQNAWAFYPLYPLLVRGVMTVTGAGWVLAAPAASMVLGAAAMLVVYRVVDVGARSAVAARPGLPLATVAILCLYPASPVLQSAYAESLALLLVALVLLLVVRRRYLLAAPVAVALGFTRPVALPLVVVVAVHAVVRWRAARAGSDPVRRGEVAGLTTLVIATLASGLAWPAICGAVTGVSDAYLRTQQAWRQGHGVGLFAGWLPALSERPVVVAAWVAAAVAVAALLARPAGRGLGPEMVAWVAGYLGYLAAVLDPATSSLVRFGLLAFPLVPAVIGLVPGPSGRRRVWVAVLTVTCVAGQFLWLWWVWRFTVGDSWTPSP